MLGLTIYNKGMGIKGRCHCYNRQSRLPHAADTLEHIPKVRYISRQGDTTVVVVGIIADGGLEPLLDRMP